MGILIVCLSILVLSIIVALISYKQEWIVVYGSMIIIMVVLIIPFSLIGVFGIRNFIYEQSDTEKVRYETTYKCLTKQLENDIEPNNISTAVSEYNYEINYEKTYQNNFWLGWFVNDDLAEMELINIEDYLE